MDLSIMLAKVMGLVLVVTSVSMIWQKDRWPGMVEQLKHNQLLVYFSGMLALVVGSLVVMSHNIWEFSWVGMVTLLGWVILLKGLLRMFFPDKVYSFAKKLVSDSRLTPVAYVCLIIGVWLIYRGFTY